MFSETTVVYNETVSGENITDTEEFINKTTIAIVLRPVTPGKALMWMETVPAIKNCVFRFSENAVKMDKGL